MKIKLLYALIFSTFLAVLLNSCSEQQALTEPDIPAATSQRSVISIEEATNDLLSLLNDINVQGTRTLSKPVKTIGDTYTVASGRSTRSDSVQPLIYIINFEDNQGYAIMSARNDTPSLIAYVESGHLTPSDTIMDAGMAVFLKSMDEYYDKKINHDKFADDKFVDDKRIISTVDGYTYGPWENIIYKQGGCCPVKWNQRAPYNNYCPVSKGKHTLAGCVPIAVAQLMACHKFPSQYEGYSFDWDAITKLPYASWLSSSTQDQVSRLIQQLGRDKNLNVNYGLDGSGAKTKHACRTLRNFGYSNPGTISKYDTDKIIPELKSSYPVLCSGYAKKHNFKIFNWTLFKWFTDGHAWLLHGLLERRRTCYYHDESGNIIRQYTESVYYPMCNWGWGGDQDGYFLSGVFDASSGPIYDDDGSTPQYDEEDPDIPNLKYQIETISGIRP